MFKQKLALLLGVSCLLSTVANAQVASKTVAIGPALEVSCFPRIIGNTPPPRSLILPIIRNQFGTANVSGSLSLAPLDPQTQIHVNGSFNFDAQGGVSCLDNLMVTSEGMLGGDAGANVGGCLTIPSSGLYLSGFVFERGFARLGYQCVARLRSAS